MFTFSALLQHGDISVVDEDNTLMTNNIICILSSFDFFNFHVHVQTIKKTQSNLKLLIQRAFDS